MSSKTDICIAAFQKADELFNEYKETYCNEKNKRKLRKSFGKWVLSTHYPTVKAPYFGAVKELIDAKEEENYRFWLGVAFVSGQLSMSK